MITILIKTLIKLIRHLNIKIFIPVTRSESLAVIEQIANFIGANQANESDENSANRNETRAQFQKGFESETAPNKSFCIVLGDLFDKNCLINQ